MGQIDTVEVRSPTLLVPTILFSMAWRENRFQFRSTIQPTNSLHCSRWHAERLQEGSLRRPCFIAVLLRVEIERRLNA